MILMQLKIMESKGDEKIWVKLESSVGFANALRRVIISGLPSFAVDEVSIYENNSSLYNEYVANRIGLIPLTYEEGEADDARVSLTLNAEGPKIVYSSDLTSSDERIKPVNEKFPIADLGENQKLRLDAYAVKGTARKHAKFQCAIASYNYFPKLKKDAKVCLNHAIEIGSPNAKTFATSECDACKLDDKGELEYKDDEFTFFVESYNNISAREHLKTALKIMKEQAKEIKKQV